MKLWHSFVKELILSMRSFYFYIELGMALIFIFILFFVIPENFSTMVDEYLYFDTPQVVQDAMLAKILSEEDLDGQVEMVEIEFNDELITVSVYETESKRMHVFTDEETAVQFADQERKFAAVIHANEQGEIEYTYYMQGYETERLRNLYLVFHNTDLALLTEQFDAQDVRPLHQEQLLLSDRENTLPSFLTFNGSLMGLFIIASYIFLDKKEGVITAYAVSPSPVWQYLLSKVGVIMVTSTITSLMIVIPVMGLQANYLLLILFLLSSGFAASALGLILTSYYDNISQAFGTLYVLVILLMLPNIAYFIPSWDPIWMHYLPTYPMLEAFKESLLPGGDTNYILQASAGFLLVGILLFFAANHRFKKTLTV